MKPLYTTILLAGSLLANTFAIAECTSNRNTSIDITKPDSTYTDHGDGTVTDNSTGLMWQKCSLGLSDSTCATGSAQTYTWQAALAAANDNSDYGYSDWYLPDLKELASLVEEACYNPAINETIFPATIISAFYWSASPLAYTSGLAWHVYFNNGGVSFSNPSGARVTMTSPSLKKL